MTHRLALVGLSISIAICAAIVVAFLLPQHTPRAAVTPAVALPVVTGASVMTVARDDSTAQAAVVSVPATLRAGREQVPAAGDMVATPAQLSGSIGHAMIGGRASWVRPSLGSRYLAMRLPKGTLVRICGAGCVVRAVNDYGPSAKIRPRRIADLSAADFERVCGPLSMGVCQVRVLLLDRVELPATDVAP